MSSDRKPLLAALLTALTLLALAVVGASPATATPATAAAPSPGQKIADALRVSPVYVDPAYAGAVPPQRQKELVARIGRTDLPIKVALVPLVKGDAFGGDPQILADIIHERFGHGDLVLITMDDFADSLSGHEWPSDTHQAQDAVSAVGFMDSMEDAGLADRVDKAVDLIAEGDGSAVYDRETAGLGGGASSAGDRPGSSKGGGVWLPVTIGVVALVLCAGGALYLVRRRRGRAYGSPFAFPQAVFAAARAADEGELRRRADAEVLALGEAVEAADVAAVPGLGQALDAYAAAGKVLDGARGLPDLAGVLALVAAGRDALAGRSDALPLCFFDPLHGRAERRVDWRPMGRRDRLDVAACDACLTAVRAKRAPEVLTDLRADGVRVPYFELPSGDSVWAATGYGSLEPSGSPDGMAERVARGDFTRGRRS